MDDSIAGPGADLIGILACITAGAVLAAADEAMVALGEPRARAARDGDHAKDAVTANRYLLDGEMIQLRLLAGRVLFLVAAVVLGYDLRLGVGGAVGRLLAVALVTLFYTMAVGIATRLATRRASALALPMLRLVRPIELALAVPAAPLVWVSNLIDRLYPPKPEDDPERVTEAVVEHMIEQGEELGSIDEQHAELLRSVIEFQDTVAREIMVPRTRMVAIEIDTALSEAVELIIEKGHSRYPVYRGTLDQLEGVLYAKDLFRMVRQGKAMEGTLAELIRTPVFFSAESQKIGDLLNQMQARRVHLAIIVDEFGGTAGMVTLEDIIEEIVGEIDDEHDSGEQPVRQIAPGRYMADADVSVHDLAAITGIELPEEAGDYESLGGMITELMGRVPEQGCSLRLGDHELIVRAADERHVARVEVVARGAIPPAVQ